MIQPESFARAELVGKVVTNNELEYTIALRDIGAAELVPADAVEPFVEIPMTSYPIKAGTVVGDTTCQIKLQPERISELQTTDVQSISALDKQVVTVPLEAHAPIPTASLAAAPADATSKCVDDSAPPQPRNAG